MTNDELNKFILNYLEKDQTKSALMISAPWGTGKSYYIQNNLIPYIKNTEKYKVVVVSAYGLSEIDEISKNIYLESRAKILNSKNEKIQVVNVIGKTILKGLTSRIGIDISCDERNLKKLYNSINLRDTLIIIEDIERTNINILSLLGYVNNLVEQDGAKVLLVANEKEMIKEDTIDNSGKVVKTLTTESKEYLRVKEKTISDTINYFPDFLNTYKNILKEFKFFEITNIDIDDISELIFEYLIKEYKPYGAYNLRSVIFGIQKTVDIISFMQCEINEEFGKALLLSNIIFSIKKKNNENLIWDKNHQGSQLGSAKYPLFRFSYDYIINQIQDREEARKVLQDFCLHNDFVNKKTKLTEDIEPIFSFYLESDSNVKKAIDILFNNLPDKNFIPPSEYGRIANYLIAIKRVLGYEDKILACLDLMVNNISNETVETVERFQYYSGIQLETNEDVEELKAFELKMKKKAEINNPNFMNFDYSIERLDNFLDEVYSQKNSYVTQKAFTKNIDSDKMIKLIANCNSEQIYRIDSTFNSIYSFSNLNDFFKEDLESLMKLRDGLHSIENDSNFDCIKKRRIKYFIEHLDSIIDLIEK